MAMPSVLRGTFLTLFAAITCVGCAGAVPSTPGSSEPTAASASKAPSASTGTVASATPSTVPSALPSSISTPAASVGWTEFTSKRYGYVVSHPSTWSPHVMMGTGGLHPGEGDEAGMDVFYGPVATVATNDGTTGLVTPAVGVSYYKLPANTRLDDWKSPTDLHIRVDHRLQPESTKDIKVGGEPARLVTYHLTEGREIYTAYVVDLVHKGAGYTIESLYSQPGNVADLAKYDAEALTTFQRMLASLKFQ